MHFRAATKMEFEVRFLLYLQFPWSKSTINLNMSSFLMKLQ